MDWVEALLGCSGAGSVSFEKFMDELKKVFDHPVCAGDATKCLLNLCQGQWSVTEYSVE